MIPRVISNEESTTKLAKDEDEKKEEGARGRQGEGARGSKGEEITESVWFILSFAPSPCLPLAPLPFAPSPPLFRSVPFADAGTAGEVARALFDTQRLRA
jgi:hypothetical protein